MAAKHPSLHNLLVLCLAFISGFIIMSIELLGGRILAPYFGGGIYVWGSIITVFMLSLGGVPPTVGFIGKVLLFRAAVDAGLLGLAIAGMLASAAGVYYYLRVVVYMYMRPAPEGAIVPERRWTTELALVASAAATLLFGVLPGPVTALLQRSDMLFHR